MSWCEEVAFRLFFLVTTQTHTRTHTHTHTQCSELDLMTFFLPAKIVSVMKASIVGCGGWDGADLKDGVLI